MYPRLVVFHPVALELYGEVDAAARRRAREWIVEALGEERAGAVEIEVAPGEPGPALVAAAGHAELLVLGAAEHYRHGYTATPKIARYCLGRSRAPIVLVPTSRTPRVADRCEEVTAGTVRHRYDIGTLSSGSIASALADWRYDRARGQAGTS